MVLRHQNSNSLSLEYIQLDRLNFLKRRVRRHSAMQIAKIGQSLERFGCVSPIIIDKDNNIICGEARVAAAIEIRWTSLPAIRVEHLSDKDVRAFRLVDNRLTEDADWDMLNLKAEFIELSTLGISIEDTGFEVAEADIIIGTCVSSADDDVIASSEREKPPISRTGDLFKVGSHLVFCGDALASETYDELLFDGISAAALVTDPPYNVPIHGHVSGTGQHREFVQGSGEMSRESFVEFLASFLLRVSAAMRAGATAFICMDWRHLALLTTEVEKAGLEVINICVWVKNNAGMGSLYRSQHEMIVVARKPGGQPINNVQLGKYGRNRSNIWRFPGASSFGSEARSGIVYHPTPKPVAMLSEAILDVTRRGDVVLDPFGGSGSTLIAAHRTGRIAYLIELDPHYVDLIIRRAEAKLGLKARCVRTGRTFDELATIRGPKRTVRQRARGIPRVQ